MFRKNWQVMLLLCYDFYKNVLVNYFIEYIKKMLESCLSIYKVMPLNLEMYFLAFVN